MKHIGTRSIETDRLLLRRFTNEDYESAYKNWCSNPKVAKYVTWEIHKNVQETKELIESWVKLYDSLETYKWAVQIKETKELIGSIDVVSKKFLPFGVCEIGYCYGEDFWGKGYGTECLKAVIKYLFDECDADVICAEHLSKNPGSGKVMIKCGLKYEGTRRGRFIDPDGVRNDLLSYSITKEEYKK